MEPWSATDSGAGRDYTDPQATSSTAWALVGVNGTVSFPTEDDLVVESRESFRIYVRPVGQPTLQVVLEADILDDDSSAILQSLG